MSGLGLGGGDPPGLIPAVGIGPFFFSFTGPDLQFPVSVPNATLFRTISVARFMLTSCPLLCLLFFLITPGTHLITHIFCSISCSSEMISTICEFGFRTYHHFCLHIDFQRFYHWIRSRSLNMIPISFPPFHPAWTENTHHGVARNVSMKEWFSLALVRGPGSP